MQAECKVGLVRTLPRHRMFVDEVQNNLQIGYGALEQSKLSLAANRLRGFAFTFASKK